MEKILMIIAPENFRDEEYFEPKQIFEDNDYAVITASKGVNIAKGVQGKTTEVDRDIEGLNPEDYEAIVLVGGSGATIYQQDTTIKEFLEIANDQEKLIAAICIAPTILAYSGILKGRKATVWNGDQIQAQILQQLGAKYTAKNVEEHENIITADGPQSAKQFAQKIVDYLER